MKKFLKKAAVILAAIITAQLLFVLPASAEAAERLYDRRSSLTFAALYSDEETLSAISSLWNKIVFISVSDGKRKAAVVTGVGSDLDTALLDADEKARKTGISPKWYKLDVVTSYEKVSYSDFSAEVKGKRYGSVRSGVAFGNDFSKALLEAEINSNSLLNYETGKFDLKRLNKYLSELGQTKLARIPASFWRIETQGYFCENNSGAVKLTNGENGSYGRRPADIDRKLLEDLAYRSSSYLSSICDESGKFVYGYYPIDNEEMEDYNIVRHAGTVWNLIMQYEMCGDERLVPVIERALGYLSESIHYRDGKTGFVLNGKALNIGGSGLALIAYCTYEETFGSDKYKKQIDALANGIIFMQKKSGGFIHEIDPDTYKTTRDYVVIFYDGEAMYGMAKAYGLTYKTSYLNCVRKAADYFIANNYEKEHSHWISYGFNELTKYSNSEKYYEFGLKNINEDNYAEKLGRVKTSSHTSEETLCASFELYDRLVTGNAECDYLSEFKADKLIASITKRAENGLDFFMFPEYAMYFEDPATVVNSLAIREDFFRIRIDDIQHFMDGYYLYWKNYDRIMYYVRGGEESEAAA